MTNYDRGRRSLGWLVGLGGDHVHSKGCCRPPCLESHLGPHRQCSVSSTADHPQERGVFIVPTTQAIIVGEYAAPMQAADANIVVTKLADYLKSVSY